MKKLDDIIKKYDMINHSPANTYEFNSHGIPTSGAAISSNNGWIAEFVFFNTDHIAYGGWTPLESPYENQIEHLYQQFIKCCKLYKQKFIMNKLDDISQDFKDENG